MATGSQNAIQANQEVLPSGIFFGLLAALIWGAWPVVSRVGVQQSLDPFDITALRFGVAGLLLLPVVLRRGIAEIGWGPTILMTGGAGIPYVLVSVTGLSLAPAGHGGVIIPSTMITCSTLGSWWILKDRPTGFRLLGLGLILFGVATIGWHSLRQSGPDTLTGDLMFVAGGMLWAVYTVTSRACRANPLQATAIVSVLSMVLYMPGYLYFRGGALATAPLDELLFQGLFQGLLAGILALLFYTKAVAILGAARGAVFAALVPAIATLLAYPLLGEVPSWMELTGVGIVTAGMIFALGLIRGRRSFTVP